jgi:hypothetical protein
LTIEIIRTKKNWAIKEKKQVSALSVKGEMVSMEDFPEVLSCSQDVDPPPEYVLDQIYGFIFLELI